MTGAPPPSVRRAVAADAGAMAALINPIIARGGTTAYEDPLDAAYFETRLAALSGAAAGDASAGDASAGGAAPQGFAHVAEAEGRMLGFQFLEPHDALPATTGDIATFVALDAAGRGVGGALFAATRAAATAAGWRALFAYIRADNAGGLAYYEKMGLKTERIDAGIPLKDGTKVDRVGKLIIL